MLSPLHCHVLSMDRQSRYLVNHQLIVIMSSGFVAPLPPPVLYPTNTPLSRLPSSLPSSFSPACSTRRRRRCHHGLVTHISQPTSRFPEWERPMNSTVMQHDRALSPFLSFTHTDSASCGSDGTMSRHGEGCVLSPI